ncbi:Ig-like domain-containing protein [Streptomyces sp. NBC_01320]|uniref:Ig-like domain-containing protein n=1 Tax=Streptomyces sp. NBC_01320 TaxID=2903824 RepID=UPI002E0D9E13|nr:Ig-like domain-containing protein [Streptomyces sp. NBC_01320]
MTPLNGTAATGKEKGEAMARRAFVVGAGALLGTAALRVPTAQASEKLAAAAEAAGDVLAFPGAEGGGRYATGGRGGSVYEVTTLADSGPGSLRDSVSGSDRTVVFRVSGNIELKGGLDITGSNLTIAGQTAPGDGICVVGNETKANGVENIIIRHLRFRGTDMLGTAIDTFGMEGCRNVMIDHCSFSWAVDECCSVYGNENLTLQWCIIAEGLSVSVHPKGRHGYGGLWGGDNVTYHHNLLIHQGGRNPRFSFVEDVPMRTDHRNNVIYNHGYTSCYGGEWADGVNIVGNYYKPGPNTLAEIAPVIVSPDRGGSWHVEGNVVEGQAEVTGDNGRGVKFPLGGVTLREEPFEVLDPIPSQTAKEAYKAVLDGVGALLPRRDATDARLVADVRNGTGRMINSQKEVGGVPPLASAEAPKDSDKDGIPDVWEKQHGLKGKDAADGSAIDPATGYSNLELYLNSLTRTGAANPVVRLTAPAIDAVHTSDTGAHDITFRAEAEAQDGATIASVVFFADDKRVGEATSAPFEAVWKNAPEGTHHLTARATDSTGTSTTSSMVPVHVDRVGPLGNWTAVDIGPVPIQGGSALAGSSFTLRGSGKLRGRSDSCHFVYQEVDAPGDEVVELIARLDSVSDVYQEVLGGIMIRENLTPDSPFNLIGVHLGDGGHKGVVKRIHSHGTEMSVGTWPYEEDEVIDAKPYWLRITLRGDEFTSEISPDSLQWTRIGYERIPMGDKVYVGMFVDGNKEANGVAHYTTAKFSQVKINH